MNNHISRMQQAAEALIAAINLSTDCMNNQIKRERIDDQIEALERAIRECAIRVSNESFAQMIFSARELRPEVQVFALLMEAAMRGKDADKGEAWKARGEYELSTAAVAKANLMHIASIKIDGEQQMIKHAVDLANYCMMAVDVAGGLPMAALLSDEPLKTDEDGGPGWAGVDQVNTEPLEIPAFVRMNQIAPHN